jgi:hypothetical protein
MKKKLSALIKIIKDAGWQIAIEKDAENIRGMIIGTEEYINDILNNKNNE